ncbi:UdgX family uracil-DNA binding protein [soil metagenome]
MFSARVDPSWSLDAWRDQARLALAAEVTPERLSWSDGNDGSLFDMPPVPHPPTPARGAAVPAAFLGLANRVLAHRDPQRHALLYRLLWRLTHGERQLLANPLDEDVYRARGLEKTIGRDLHKMKAFVRFREVPGSKDHFVAWFEPEHQILDLVAPFFVRRFAGMRWAIMTPYRSAAWDGEALLMGEGALASDAPAEDGNESLWQTYYSNIFNPARLNPRMMRQEMPQKYWKNLPETHQLPALIRGAGARVRDMAARAAQAPAKPRMVERALLAAKPVPNLVGLAALRDAASRCRACPLWQPATQTVFGEGPGDARIMLVGEQPGDAEDLRGQPFVGPAGEVLDHALAALGIDRSSLYLTNVVKHFKFTRSGKVRLHSKANATEQRACRQWLDAEIASINPAIIVCLGATAASALLGPGVELMQVRGKLLHLPDGRQALATVHPAWVLRHRGTALVAAAYQGFVEDLSQLLDVL